MEIVINGNKATAEDLAKFSEWLQLQKIKILFFKAGSYYINIITD